MTTQNSELATLDTVEKKIAKLDELANSYSSALSISSNPFASAITLATAMNNLRELLTEDVMAPIMALMNSPLGFLTDRTGKPRFQGDSKWKPCYTWEEVRDCVIESALRGFYTVGNEMNIIAGRFYAAKNGLRRKVSTYPGLTDLKETYDVPRNANGGAVVKAKATWNLNGTPDSLEREFPIKGDDYATADSYLGKATRKLLHAILEKLTGQTIPEGDVNDIPIANAREVSEAKPAIATEVEQSKPNEWRGVKVAEVSEKKGKKDGKEVIAWAIKLEDGRICYTNDKDTSIEAGASKEGLANIDVREGDKNAMIVTKFEIIQEAK